MIGFAPLYNLLHVSYSDTYDSYFPTYKKTTHGGKRKMPILAFEDQKKRYAEMAKWSRKQQARNGLDRQIRWEHSSVDLIVVFLTFPYLSGIF